MVISIDETAEVPIYQQIRNQIVLGISDGRLKPGEQLPTVRALAGEIGINSMTVNKAYALLKQEGYIYTDRRNGAHVRNEFTETKELQEKSKIILQQVISEAKIFCNSKDHFPRPFFYPGFYPWRRRTGPVFFLPGCQAIHAERPGRLPVFWRAPLNALKILPLSDGKKPPLADRQG